MLPNNQVCRSPTSLLLLKLELILHDDPAENRLQSIRSEEATRTRLPPESKVHIRRTDAHEAGRRGRGQGCRVWFFLARVFFGCSESVSVLRILAPPEPVEGVWVRDERWVFADGTGGKTYMCAGGNAKAVG